MAKRRPNITHCSQEVGGGGEGRGKRRHRIKGREDAAVALLSDLKLVSCQDLFSE